MSRGGQRQAGGGGGGRGVSRGGQTQAGGGVCRGGQTRAATTARSKRPRDNEEEEKLQSLYALFTISSLFVCCYGNVLLSRLKKKNRSELMR